MAGVSSANATTLYWEGGAGTWDTSGTNTVWSSSSGNPADSAWPSSGATDAVIHTSSATNVVTLGVSLTNVDSLLITQGILNIQGNLLKRDASTFTTITIDGGELRRNNGGNYNPIVIGSNGATLYGGNQDSQWYGGISGSGDLVVNGAGGNQIFYAQNTFDGTTTFKGANCMLNEAGSFGRGDVEVNITANLYVSLNYHYTFDHDIHVTKGNFQFNGGAANHLTLTGALNIEAAGTMQVRNSGVFEVSKGTIAGRIFGNNVANVQITKISSEVLYLTYTGANTAFLTGWDIKEGFVNFNSTANLGADGKTKLDGGGLQWAAGTTTDVSAKLNATLGAAGGTFDTNGNNVAISTALTGTGALTKVGAGTLTLSDTTSYSGKTTVSGGVLAFSGSGGIATSSAIDITGGELRLTDAAQINATAAITVTAGQLSLGASIANDINVTGTGVLSAAGSLTTGDVAIANGGTLLISGDVMLDAGNKYIQLDGTTGATLSFDLSSGDASVNFMNQRLSTNGAVNVQFDASSGNELMVLGVDAATLQNWTLNGAPVDTQYTWVDDGHGVFSVVPIPEPSTYALLGGVGALALALLRRRRKGLVAG